MINSIEKSQVILSQNQLNELKKYEKKWKWFKKNWNEKFTMNKKNKNKIIISAMIFRDFP